MPRETQGGVDVEKEEETEEGCTKTKEPRS
jgi:hypothetical protein